MVLYKTYFPTQPNTRSCSTSRGGAVLNIREWIVNSQFSLIETIVMFVQKDQNDTIKCHHGENECFGNKVIGCVLHQISITGALKFVNCTSTMISADPKREKYPISEVRG